MKTVKIGLGAIVLIAGLALVSAFTNRESSTEHRSVLEAKSQHQTVNLFVTHGHCNTPFGGAVSDLSITTLDNDDFNPLEKMQMSFSIDPNSFKACAGDDLTARVKTPGLFIGKGGEMITFKSNSIYTIGIDWYQVNGKMSIKGVEREVKLFVNGIRTPSELMPDALIVEGRLNLDDWGIDYDKIVNGDLGEPAVSRTQWLHLNMKIELRQ